MNIRCLTIAMLLSASLCSFESHAGKSGNNNSIKYTNLSRQRTISRHAARRNKKEVFDGGDNVMSTQAHALVQHSKLMALQAKLKNS